MLEKAVNKFVFFTLILVDKFFTQSFALEIHGLLQKVLHWFSTKWINFLLAIDFLLDFFNLVAERKIQFKIFLDFFYAMHDGGVIFNANLGSDFVSTEV